MPSSHLLAYLVYLLLSILSTASASAAGQYHLNVNEHVSDCFVECHARVIRTVHNTDEDPLGNEQAIGGNCMDEPYLTAVPKCLTVICASAPDAAYALEFGVNWCRKAGVDVRDKLVFPNEYTQGAAKEYFQSEAYTSDGTPATCQPSVSVVLGVAFLLLPAALGLVVA